MGGTGGGLEPDDIAQRNHRAGPGGGAAQATVIRMAETPTGGLDVGLGPINRRSTVVVYHHIQAGQAGAGRQEDCQEEECLDPAKLRSPGGDGALHGLEYTHWRSTTVARRTGPSVGSRNQNAAPLP